MGIMSDCLITPERYDIIDTQTQQVVASRLTRKRATTKADQLDNAFGAVRYIVKPIWANQEQVDRENNLTFIEKQGFYDMNLVKKWGNESLAYVVHQIRREQAAKSA